MTLQQTQFSAALSAWMTLEGITLGRAARWLGVKPRDLQAWKDGTREPSKAELTRVLERIAAGEGR